jgi:predicted Zn-dependent peptidase
VNESIKLIDHEINKLQDMLVSETELSNVKDFVKSGLFLSMENMEVIMTRIARNEMYFGKYIPLEEVVESIELVERQDIKKLAGDIFGGHELTVAGLGPL